MLSTRSCKNSIKLEVSVFGFETSSSIKFPENSFSGRRDVRRERPDGRTDRHELNNRFSQFCELAYKRPDQWQ